MFPLQVGPAQQLPQAGFDSGLQIPFAQPSRGTCFADIPHALFLQLSLWSRIIRNNTVGITQTQLKHLLSTQDPTRPPRPGLVSFLHIEHWKGQTHPQAATTPLQLSVVFWHTSHNQS